MKRIHIFKSGKHTSASGTELDFSEDQLKASVLAYDPKLHEAPVVVGHPKDNHPAYGWVRTMEYQENGGVFVVPDQIDEAFEEMVQKGRFKKVSASFYTPESPVNPVPGTYYLRHVGFLGAQPPAVKGLKGVEFNEAEEGVIEFSDSWDSQTQAGIFRRLREFIIDKFSKEEADQIIPDYAVSDLENSARDKLNDSDDSAGLPAFGENENPDLNGGDMDPKEMQAEIDRLKQQNTDLETANASFQERENTLKSREAETRKKLIAGHVDGLVSTGQVLPVQRDNLVAFMETLSEEVSLDFSEGDQKKAVSQLEAMKAITAGMPKQVPFGEQGDSDESFSELDPNQIAQRAKTFKAEQEAKGIEMSFTEACESVEAGKDKQ